HRNRVPERVREPVRQGSAELVGRTVAVEDDVAPGLVGRHVLAAAGADGVEALVVRQAPTPEGHATQEPHPRTSRLHRDPPGRRRRPYSALACSGGPPTTGMTMDTATTLGTTLNVGRVVYGLAAVV